MLDDDHDDDGPSSRYSYWAEILDVGEDGESTLSLAGISSRSVVDDETVHKEPWHDGRWWVVDFGGWRFTFLMVFTCLIMLLLVGAVIKYYLECREMRQKNERRSAVNNSSVSATEPPERRTLSALKPNTTRRSKLVRVISSEEKHPELLEERNATIVQRRHPQQPLDKTVMALYPESRVTRFSRQDSEADAEQVAGHVIAYKEAFAKAGMVINDDTVCQIAIERVNLHEKERLHEFREYRSLVIQKHHRAEDHEHTERRHREALKCANQDNDWLIKLFQVRDRSYNALTNSFSWLILCRVCVGLLFQGRHLYREGLPGVIGTLLGRFSTRCTPITRSTLDDDSWKAYLLSPLGGAYNYVSVASASVSKSSCYAMHGFVGVLLLIGALFLPAATKHLPRMVRTVIFGICALALSDTSLEFIGAWATVYSAYVIFVWHYCRQFTQLHEDKTPTAQSLSKFHLKLDDITNASSMLPPLAVIVYSCQMATAKA